VRPIGQVLDRDLADLETALRTWQVRPIGTEGYAKAEVTLGGVATTALSQRTMQSIAVPGLFVIGEAVDVTGWLGGYNFQWAWASGFVAGEVA
jgi:predicted flavoprotein YhiN